MKNSEASKDFTKGTEFWVLMKVTKEETEEQAVCVYAGLKDRVVFYKEELRTMQTKGKLKLKRREKGK